MADNWYVILELEFDPPVENERIIAERIDEKAKFWSTHFNDFKMGAQYRTWHQNIPQIKKDMLGEANIRKQISTEASTIVYGPVDKFLKIIGRKGSITADEGDKLAKKLKISVDTVKKRARSLGVQWAEGANTDFQSVYDKYYKIKPQNTATYDGMRQLLIAFRVDNLYDFLYANTTVKNVNKLPCKTLRLRAEEKKKMEFYKTDNVSGTGKKLCSHCDIVFKDDSSKQKYDKYLEYIKRKSVLDDAKSIAEISGKLTTEQSDEVISQLTQIFCDRKIAEDLFAAFCRVERISYSAVSASETSANIKICRCGCMNDVLDGRKVCSNCGLELVIKCPECGTESDANIRVCKCGFQFANIDKAVALCEQAERAIDSLDFAVAKVHLSDAEHYWKNSSKISSLKQRLTDCEKKVGSEVVKMRENIKNKRYCEARKQYQSIQRLFSSYSDPLLKQEIEQEIEKAKVFYNQAKAAKNERDILELCAKAYDVCADLPGIRELIPAPGNVTGFKVLPNAVSQMNIISWETVGDRSIRYVVVRSNTGWVQNLSDGQVIYRGSASSYADNHIEAGIPYYYNVFAERTGTYSKGASGDFEEVINLFEIQRVAVTAAESSLNVTWDMLPNDATAEIYEIRENGTQCHVASSVANNYLITNLENEKTYQYRVSLSYLVAGKRQETKGIIIFGTPICPPLPIDTLRVKSLKEGQFEAVWVQSKTEEIRLYGSVNKPVFHVGDVIALSDLEQSMSQLQQQSLSGQMLNCLGKNEVGASFQYTGKEVLYVVAVAVKAGTAVLGNIARASTGDNVVIQAVRPVNGKVNIYIEPPKDATGFVVLYRFDQFSTDIEDVNTVRKYVALRQYQLNSAIVLDTLEDRKYYFTVYAEFKQDGEKDYSSGTDYLFDNSMKLSIIYSINVNKKMFGESSVVIEFESDCRDFTLPDIEIMSAVGNTPMFKASAKLFYSIPSQVVNGSAKVWIPFPKTMPKNTYIKAFFKDDSTQNRNQLRLKLKSNYKIS